MPRKLIVLPLLIAASIFCHAQQLGTVKGTVRDSTGKGIDAVTILIEQDEHYNTTSDKAGHFEMKVPANQKLTLVLYSMTTNITRKTILVKPNETLPIDLTLTVKLNMLDSAVIKGKRTEEVGVGNIDIKNTPFLSAPNESFETTLKYQGLGVQQNNELSSSYSVRGGNYDENLVYVNDFEIQRPYLIRSGQQEGLSFINPDMVGDVKFSSGGFQAKYGDKMSSVLDVTYRRPDSLHGSAYGSLLGWGAHLEGADKKRRLTFSIGARQRNSQYVLKSLDTQGEYSPNFIDVQGYLTYQISPKVELALITNYSRNKYSFIPVDRETNFGLLTDVLRLTVYYNGQEADQYQNMMNGLSLTYQINDDLRIKFLTSYYLDREQENYDIIGQYFLSQVQNDLGQSNFGQVLYNLGVGGEEDWARNSFNSDVIYGGMRGSWFKKKHNLQWGLDYKHEIVDMTLSEWTQLDSAGYSVPFSYTTSTTPTVINGNTYYNNSTPQIQLFSVLKSQYNFSANRISGFLQDSYKWGDSAKFSFNYGVRFQYYDLNREAIATPRAQLSYKPKGRKDIVLTLAGGLYYQPPFYREMLNGFTGAINTDLKSQKSAQIVAGLNYAFMAWNRHFSFTTEAYYKYLWALDPYVYNDVLIDYLGTNSARGYAGGVDMRLNGELAEGAESWITLSVMNTEQIIPGSYYVNYYDSSGNQIANNEQTQASIAKRDTIRPRYLPRPTDQRVSFSIFFQDYLSKKAKFIKVHIALSFASGLPFGPPGSNFYQDVLRTPPYERVDIGFSGQLWNPHWAKKKTTFNQGLRGVWLSLEVFNLFDIQNVASYTWIRDIYNNQYAVPNYLSSRRLNAKLMFSF